MAVLPRPCQAAFHLASAPCICIRPDPFLSAYTVPQPVEPSSVVLKQAAMQYELDQQALPAEQEDGSESSETHLLPLPESQERDYQTLPLLQMEHAV